MKNYHIVLLFQSTGCKEAHLEEKNAIFAFRKLMNLLIHDGIFMI
jgi:hypothetical protein